MIMSFLKIENYKFLICFFSRNSFLGATLYFDRDDPNFDEFNLGGNKNQKRLQVKSKKDEVTEENKIPSAPPVQIIDFTDSEVKKDNELPAVEQKESEKTTNQKLSEDSDPFFIKNEQKKYTTPNDLSEDGSKSPSIPLAHIQKMDGISSNESMASLSGQNTKPDESMKANESQSSNKLHAEAIDATKTPSVSDSKRSEISESVRSNPTMKNTESKDSDKSGVKEEGLKFEETENKVQPIPLVNIIDSSDSKGDNVGLSSEPSTRSVKNTESTYSSNKDESQKTNSPIKPKVEEKKHDSNKVVPVPLIHIVDSSNSEISKGGGMSNQSQEFKSPIESSESGVSGTSHITGKRKLSKSPQKQLVEDKMSGLPIKRKKSKSPEKHIVEESKNSEDKISKQKLKIEDSKTSEAPIERKKSKSPQKFPVEDSKTSWGHIERKKSKSPQKLKMEDSGTSNIPLEHKRSKSPKISHNFEATIERRKSKSPQGNREEIKQRHQMKENELTSNKSEDSKGTKIGDHSRSHAEGRHKKSSSPQKSSVENSKNSKMTERRKSKSPEKQIQVTETSGLPIKRKKSKSPQDSSKILDVKDRSRKSKSPTKKQVEKIGNKVAVIPPFQKIDSSVSEDINLSSLGDSKPTSYSSESDSDSSQDKIRYRDGEFVRDPNFYGSASSERAFSWTVGATVFIMIATVLSLFCGAYIGLKFCMCFCKTCNYCNSNNAVPY